MSVNTKMTALADEIRTLSGTTDKLGLDAMKSNVNEANGEIEGQEDLIAQISAALEGKATPDIGIQDIIGTCTVNITYEEGYTDGIVYTAIEDNLLVIKSIISAYQSNILDTSLVLENVMCGSAIAFSVTSGLGMSDFRCSGGVEKTSNYMISSNHFMAKAPITNGAVGVITVYDND